MDTQNLNLNNVFDKNARIYQTRPVMAAKYKPGMENGFCVFYRSTGKQEGHMLWEGMRFFPNKAEAWEFINKNEISIIFDRIRQYFYTILHEGMMNMNVKQAIVKRIEMLCKERKVAYNELANLCGITPSTVYSILAPKRKNITLSTIKKICDGLDMSLEQFFHAELFSELDQEIQ